MPFRIILHLILINAPVDLIILIFPVHTWDKPEITICIDFWTILKIILIISGVFREKKKSPLIKM